MTLMSPARPTPTNPASTPPTLTRCDIRVMVVDDHPAVRLGVRALIEAQPDMRVVAEAGSVDEALKVLGTPIDVAVVDYHLRASSDGLALVAHLGRLRPSPRVLVYSAFADIALAAAAVIAGVNGLLGKHELVDELCNAIRALALGRSHLPAVPPAVAHAMSARLEPHDQAIFEMLLHGLATVAIAERLSLTPEQVTEHRSAMLRLLKPPRAESALPGDRATPLDYDRPRRRLRFTMPKDTKPASSASTATVRPRWAGNDGTSGV